MHYNFTENLTKITIFRLFSWLWPYPLSSKMPTVFLKEDLEVRVVALEVVVKVVLEAAKEDLEVVKEALEAAKEDLEEVKEVLEAAKEVVKEDLEVDVAVEALVKEVLAVDFKRDF